VNFFLNTLHFFRVVTYTGSVPVGTTKIFTYNENNGNLWALFDSDIFRLGRGFQVHYDIGMVCLLLVYVQACMYTRRHSV